MDTTKEIIKVAILSRYQKTIARGAESFVTEIARGLQHYYQVDILSGKDADDIEKIIKGKYQVVIPMNGRFQSLKVLFGKLFGGYKIISIGESGIGWDILWNCVMGKPDVFVALTEKMRHYVRPWAWGSKVVKIPNGVDLDKFNPQGAKWQTNLSKPIVLSVGALEWYKHHQLTIEAVAQLPNVSLLIVGKGSQEQEIKKLAEEKIAGRFQIISAPFEELPQIYRSADVFTLPSWDREAFGIVYIEALASNLPVVAPDDLSRKEIVGDGGVLVDVTNSQKYAAALQKALDTKWDIKPREQSLQFGWNVVMEKYHKLIEELL